MDKIIEPLFTPHERLNTALLQCVPSVSELEGEKWDEWWLCFACCVVLVRLELVRCDGVI